MTEFIYIPSWSIGIAGLTLLIPSIIIFCLDLKENPYHHTVIGLYSFIGCLIGAVITIAGFYPYIRMIQVIP